MYVSITFNPIMQPNTPAQTLSEIQTAIREVDTARTSPSLTPEEREALELSAVALRTAERVAVARVQKELLADLADCTTQLNQLSRDIRARVTRMNRAPRALDTVETILHTVLSLLTAISKWL